MLATVELDNQPPLATNKLHVVPTDWLLADKFEAAELTTSDARPQCKFGGRDCPPQRSRTLGALLILTSQRGDPSTQELGPSP